VIRHEAVRDDVTMLDQLGVFPPKPAAGIRMFAWRANGRAARAAAEVTTKAAQAAATALHLRTARAPVPPPAPPEGAQAGRGCRTGSRPYSSPPPSEWAPRRPVDAVTAELCAPALSRPRGCRSRPGVRRHGLGHSRGWSARPGPVVSARLR
jgi:hypothetical protein